MAKDILVWCYQADLIGPYRRLNSGWRIRMSDDEIILDDLQVIETLGRKAGVGNTTAAATSEH